MYNDDVPFFVALFSSSYYYYGWPGWPAGPGWVLLLVIVVALCFYFMHILYVEF